MSSTNEISSLTTDDVAIEHEVPQQQQHQQKRQARKKHHSKHKKVTSKQGSTLESIPEPAPERVHQYDQDQQQKQLLDYRPKLGKTGSVSAVVSDNHRQQQQEQIPGEAFALDNSLLLRIAEQKVQAAQHQSDEERSDDSILADLSGVIGGNNGMTIDSPDAKTAAGTTRVESSTSRRYHMGLTKRGRNPLSTMSSTGAMIYDDDNETTLDDTGIDDKNNSGGVENRHRSISSHTASSWDNKSLPSNQNKAKSTTDDYWKVQKRIGNNDKKNDNPTVEDGIERTVEVTNKYKDCMWRHRIPIGVATATTIILFIILLIFLMPDSDVAKYTKEEMFANYVLEFYSTLSPYGDTETIVNRWNTDQAVKNARDWLLTNDKLFNNALIRSKARVLQRFALVTMYYSMNGQYWSRNSDINGTNTSSNNNTNIFFLDPTTHECQWEGIVCAERWYDTINNASQNNVSDITHNRVIPISNNTDRRQRQLRNKAGSATQTIISYFGGQEQKQQEQQQQQRKLQDDEDFTSSATDIVGKILLPDRNLSGTIPIELAAIGTLVDIDFSDNSITGSIPSTLFAVLSYLKGIDFSNNTINGTVPNLLWYNGNVQKVYLNDNKLTGTIGLNDKTSVPFHQLTTVWLQNNELTGSVPSSWFRSLTELKEWIVFNNNFTGSIPDPPSKIQYLDLSNNSLTGTIPVTLWYTSAALQSLSHLYLNDNKITGTVPYSNGNLNMGNLQVVWLQSNNLLGTIPYEFGANWTNIVELLIHDNRNLRGTLGPYFEDLEIGVVDGSINVTEFEKQKSAQCSLIFPKLSKLMADCFIQPPAINCSCCSLCL